MYQSRVYSSTSTVFLGVLLVYLHVLTNFGDLHWIRFGIDHQMYFRADPHQPGGRDTYLVDTRASDP